MRKCISVKKMLRMILGVCFVYCILVGISIWNFGKIDEARPCDGAIILGAGTGGGVLSPVYRERVNHGIHLLEQDMVAYLILTGGVGEGNSSSDARVAMDYAMSMGVPRERILLEETSTITEENLANSKLLMEEYGLEEVILVSDPLHMKRACLMAQDLGIKVYSSPTPSTMYRSLRTKLPFLLREEFFYIGYRLLRPFRF